ncbi:MAG: ParA family protein [Anaerolineae bacterium]
MRRIAVSLTKGGVGKTTTAVNLAAGLAAAGHEVLLIDADTQGQAGKSLGVQPASGLNELVAGEASLEQVIVPARERLALLAGSKSLAGLKRLIARRDYGAERTLAEALAPLEGRYDFVIVDTAPGWDVLTINVLFYADEVLAPVSLEVMTLQGLSEFAQSLASIQRYRDSLTLRYVLPTFLDRRVRKSEEILAQLARLLSHPALPADPLQRAAFRGARLSATHLRICPQLPRRRGLSPADRKDRTR